LAFTDATYVCPGCRVIGAGSDACCQPLALSEPNDACASSVPPAFQILPTCDPLSAGVFQKRTDVSRTGDATTNFTPSS
jgi:hypothetical protein